MNQGQINKRGCWASSSSARANVPVLLSLLSLTFSRAGVGECNGLPLSEDTSDSPAGLGASRRTGPGAISATLCAQPCPARGGGAQL